MAQEEGVSQLVVVGSSAGGIDALSTLVATLPADFPAPLVIAQHLDPARRSHLADILERRGALPVRQVADHAPLEPGVVYVVPANHHVEITDHAISTHVEDGPRAKPSVDLLLSTAAQVFGESLIAVILTGTGRDGATGARAVKEAGGMVVIQNPHTAEFAGMPESIAPPLVDVVADLDTIGPLLHDLLTGAYIPKRPAENRSLNALLEQLHDASGIDFSRYKTPTILRRVQRRMAATGMRRLDDYARYVQTHPEEYERLVGTFLIKVTEFFRDPDLFAYLRDQVLPGIVASARRRDNEIRLWSAGCATGEDAYSLAILMAEALGDDLERFTVRIFATDLDPAAITFARRGIYSVDALAPLSPELIARYFSPIDGGYEVNKRVRGLVVFGQHDLGQRPPFPHIDLCLCRNVLIYFTAELQQRALQLFAFALRDGGYLVLGKAETPGTLGEFFAPAHPQLKIYRRVGDRMLIPTSRIKDTVPTRFSHGMTGLPQQRVLAPRPREAARPRTSADGDAALLRSLPVGVVVVDRHYDIQTINTAARHLLGIHGPALDEDVVHLTERLPAPGLRAAIDAARGGEPQELMLDVETPQGERRCLQVTCTPRPLAADSAEQEDQPAEGAVLILAADVTAAEAARRARDGGRDGDVARLREELARAEEERARLEARVQRAAESNRELETANEQLSLANADLRSSNEEFLVGNEELQAAMEEVETLNEELQATNEELETLNEELQATVEELNTTNDDLEARSLELQQLVAEREDERRVSDAERARLEAVLSSMGDAVLLVGQTGATVLTNAAAERLFGADADIAPEDAEGRLLPAEETPQARAARGETFTQEFTLPGSEGPEGTRRWLEAKGRPVADGGPERGGVVVIRDITDRNLRRLQEEFLALASHELRTPLTPMRGYLDLLGKVLRADANTDERALRYLDRMREQLMRLMRLVDDLLEVGRLQEGKLSLRREEVDLAALVRGLAEAVQATGEGPPVQLDVEAAADALVVAGDATRLSQVVLNLLNNAARYASGSPQIDVRLRRDAEAAAVLEVRDYGPGIPRARLARLFDRFYQGGAQGEQGGLGIGLFVTRELVRAHGGEIAVRSVEGEGATFTVRLPLADADDQLAGADDQAPASDASARQSS